MPSALPPEGAPSAPPATQRAIVQAAKGTLIVSNTPLPPLLPGWVLVQTAAVALNPADHKMPANFPAPGATAGWDFAGTIVRVCPPLAAPLRVGDRVCGAVHGSNPSDHETGAFAEYVRAEADLLLKVPGSMAWGPAAALGGVGHGTLCIALWESLGVPGRPEKPAAEPQHVLVYGGSTATGTMAIQLLKLSGLLPITTCSPHSFPLVKSYGAAAVFDYTSPTCGADIRAYTSNALFYALDCITDPESVATCYAALGRAGGMYTCLEACPPEWRTRKAVTSDFVLGYEIFGRDVVLGGEYSRKANQERREAYVRWVTVMQGLVDHSRIKAHPLRSVEGGWEGVLHGLAVLKKGGVSGQKLVVLVDVV
ncbi:hypothetical protein MMC13_005949 [Lambiella insularis]|nr:hypothetical protein [Lambiella insularis]